MGAEEESSPFEEGRAKARKGRVARVRREESIVSEGEVEKIEGRRGGRKGGREGR